MSQCIKSIRLTTYPAIVSSLNLLQEIPQIQGWQGGVERQQAGFAIPRCISKSLRRKEIYPEYRLSFLL